MKICKRCETEHEETEFPIKRPKTNGRSNVCRRCLAEIGTINYAKRKANGKGIYKGRTIDTYSDNASRLNSYWKIPSLSHLPEIPKWKM